MTRRKIFITGIAGTGKSTVCNELIQMGYEAYNIEDIPEMFTMYHEGTHEEFIDFSNADPLKMSTSDWICDVAALKKLMDSQQNEIAFYCGTADNTDELLPLFDQALLLEASPRILRERLETREGTEACGNTTETREIVMNWKPTWEKGMEDKGMKVIVADGTPNEVAAKIIDSSIT